MEVIIADLESVPKHIDWATHVISLLGPTDHEKRPEFPQPSENCLLLDFDDIFSLAKMGHKEKPPTKEDVEAIILFGNRLPNDSNLLVHCHAGLSRSPAAAYIALCGKCLQSPPRDLALYVKHAQPLAIPNPLMVQMADELLEKKGTMLKALEVFMPETTEGGIIMPPQK